MEALALEDTQIAENEVVHKSTTKSEIIESTKKKSLLDYAKELAKKPLFTIAEEDRDLVYGSNMMTRLLQEE